MKEGIVMEEIKIITNIRGQMNNNKISIKFRKTINYGQVEIITEKMKICKTLKKYNKSRIQK
jgi:hypothetical protein